MIYLFCGSDTEKVRAKAFAWVAAARAKEPNLSYVRLAREELTEAALREAGAAASLFAKRTLTVLDDPFARAKAGEEGAEEAGPASGSLVEEHLEQLAASENVIVLLAPNLLAAKAKKLATLAAKSYMFDAPAAKEARGFNHALVGALAARSRERLWLELVRALRHGDAPEMLHGLLHWKARDLMEKGGARWRPAEARALSMHLLALLMESRRGGLDLAQSLERFALSL